MKQLATPLSCTGGDSFKCSSAVLFVKNTSLAKGPGRGFPETRALPEPNPPAIGVTFPTSGITGYERNGPALGDDYCG